MSDERFRLNRAVGKGPIRVLQSTKHPRPRPSTKRK